MHTLTVHPQVSRKRFIIISGPGLGVHHAGHHPGAQEGRDDPPHLENKQSHRE